MTLIPPAIATWMLKHLVLGDRNEALEGDLLEEFHRRRSGVWYWRQVLRAVLLSYSKASRTGWGVIGTVLFAGLWVYGVYEVMSLTAHSSLLVAFDHWIRHEPRYGQPVLMASMMVVYIAVPLAVYLALARNLTRRAFTLGFAVGAAGQVVILLFAFHRVPFFYLVSRALNTPLNYLFAYMRAEHWDVRLLMYRWQVMQWSLPLLAAICATKANKSALRRLPGDIATTMRNLMLGSPRQPPCEPR